jgi:hypothetical protein
LSGFPLQYIGGGVYFWRTATLSPLKSSSDPELPIS